MFTITKELRDQMVNILVSVNCSAGETIQKISPVVHALQNLPIEKSNVELKDKDIPKKK